MLPGMLTVVGMPLLEEGFGAFSQFIESWFIQIAGLAWMDNCNLAALGRFHQLPVSSCVGV